MVSTRQHLRDVGQWREHCSASEEFHEHPLSGPQLGVTNLNVFKQDASRGYRRRRLATPACQGGYRVGGKEDISRGIRETLSSSGNVGLRLELWRAVPSDSAVVETRVALDVCRVHGSFGKVYSNAFRKS